jgi:hypothetical protein
VPVIGAGPIVTVDCTLACSATATVTVTAGTARRLDIPTKLGSGAAQLDGAGTTYAFPRLRKRARRGLAGAVHATLTTTVTAAGGGAPVVLSQPLTLKS